MAIEIERKFLVKATAFQKVSPLLYSAKARIVQGYLHDSGPTSRVRLITEGTDEDPNKAYLTIKGKKTSEFGRPEFEYEIPVSDARDLLKMCDTRVLVKTRYAIPSGCGLTWEVDVFHKRLSGLVMAEIELPSDSTAFATQPWLGVEVSSDKRYTNKRLSISQRIPR